MKKKLELVNIVDDKKVEPTIEVNTEQTVETGQVVDPALLVPVISKKIFYIESVIDKELFSELVQFVNQFADDHMIELWLNSPGGDCMYTEMIRDIIEEYQIPIVACYLIGSSAFNLFMTANTYKRIVSGTRGIFHKTYMTGINIDQDFRPMINKEFKKFNGEEFRTVQETVDKIPLTDKQRKKFKKNGDILFTYKQIVDIIKTFNDENFILDNQ